MNSTDRRPTDAHWRGFTPMADFDRLVVRDAQGCWLTTTDGRRLLDGVSSLWCNVHGHRHPKIDAALVEQLGRVAHVTTLGMSGETTEILAERLAQITPGDLAHTFFSSDGSSAVEAALKMAFQYWRQCPNAQPAKTQFLALGSAYHGDTTGAVSLGGIKYFHQLFAPILFSPIRGPVPCTYRLPDGVTSHDACEHYAGKIEHLLRQHHASLAAVVMEPLVQGAAGLITHPRGLLAEVRRLCDQFGVLLIVDEVATGFGRTGRMFACEHESVTPDILCIGKGLTGGYLPMAATIARPHVFEAFLAPATDSRQFFHGHTFGGNPLAAAAALASIGLFDETDLIASVAEKSAHLRNRLSVLVDHPHVGDIRGRGLMVGIEVVAHRDTRAPFDSSLQIGRRICKEAVDRGVWIRPLSDVLVAMPPLVATIHELDILADAIIESTKSVLAEIVPPLTDHSMATRS